MQHPIDSTESTDSPAALVSSSDVVGTSVYSRDGTHLGSIDHVMIDKVSGKIAYAVMAFGGVLGIGEEHYPVPWPKLEYSLPQGGYVTDITAEQLQAAPARTSDWTSDRNWERATYDHYGVPFYWF